MSDRQHDRMTLAERSPDDLITKLMLVKCEMGGHADSIRRRSTFRSVRYIGVV